MPDLPAHLAAMQQRCDAVTGLGQVSIRSHAALVEGVRDLAGCIEQARQEIASLCVDDIAGCTMPAATAELDAVVLHTADAAGTILDVCETLDAMTVAGDAHDAITRATARIYEACSFQDIIGQRVTKVVQTLQRLEGKIGQIVRVAADQPPVAGGVKLLHGPRSCADALDQAAIDALLARPE